MRRRILLLTLGMTTLVVLAFAIPLILLTRSAIVQRNESAALEEARTIGLYLVINNPTVDELTAYVDDLNARSERRTTVTLPDGRTIGATPVTAVGGRNAGGYPSADPNASPRPSGFPNGGSTQPGFQGPRDDSVMRDVAGGGKVAEIQGRSASIDGDQFFQVQVYLSASARTDGLGSWLLLLAGVSLGLLALSAAGAEVLTRRIVRPLTRTAAVAHELSQGGLAARAPTRGPREVAEVGSALNGLAGRIDELISQERETVADLSHRLRTPLTALRLEAEALSVPAEAERIGDRVSVLERTLTNVIHAARRPQREGLAPSADATAVVAERVDFWAALAEDQDRDVARELPVDPILVRCAEQDLAAAVDALLGNVFAHTDEGVALSATLARTDDGAVLTIADDGPGFTAEAVVRGRSDRGSSGLGLDIARQAAEASGGALSIGTGPDGRGAVVTLTLGAP